MESAVLFDGISVRSAWKGQESVLKSKESQGVD